MIIKYKNTIDDFIELNFYLNTKLKDRKRKNFFFRYGYILIIIIVSIWYYKHDNEYRHIVLIALILLSLLWLIIQPIIVKIELRYRFKNKENNNEYLYTQKILKLKNNKIVILKNDNKTEITFRDISDIVVYKDRIFIFEENYNIFAIIPVKSFINDSEKVEFIDTIKKNLY